MREARWTWCLGAGVDGRILRRVRLPCPPGSMQLLRTIVVGPLLALAAACGSTPASSEPAEDAGVDVGDDAGASDGTTDSVEVDARLDAADGAEADVQRDTSTEVGVDTAPDSADDVTVPVGEVQCTWLAVVPPPLELPPEPDDGALDADCPLQRIEQRVEPGDVYATETYRWSNDGAELTWERTDASGAVVERRAWTDEADGRTATRTFLVDGEPFSWSTWTYDGEGRLVGYEGDNGRTEPEQTTARFDADGRLASFTQDGPRGFAAEVRYDDTGVLASIGGTVGELPFEYVYAFDEAARPLSVVRSLGEARVVEQRWEWEGRSLARYSFFIDPSGRLAGEDLASWTLPALDRLVAPLSPSTMDPRGFDAIAHWAASTFVQDPNGCVIPPHGAGHGYPSSAGLSYALGTPLDERPQGIGFVYAANTFDLRYGDQSWYGHDGVNSSWPPEFVPGFQKTWAITIDYEASGAPTRELVVVEGTEETDGGRELTTRIERAFRREGGLLAEDALTIELPDGTRFGRELAFDRDERGRLLERQLREGDRQIAQQTWTHDDERVLRHTVRVHDATWSWNGLAPADPELGPRPTGAYEWTYDEQGRLTYYGQLGLDDAPALRPLERNYAYVDEGTVVITQAEGSATRRTTETYDEAGQLTRRDEDFGDDGSIDTWQAWDFMEGRLVRLILGSSSAPSNVTERSWACIDVD